MPLYLRPALPNDNKFIHDLVYQTLFEQLYAWAWHPSLRQSILEMQVRAKQGSYAVLHPNAHHAIIMLDDDAVGRLMIDRTGEYYELVDISIVAKHRSAGIGTRLILAMCTEAEMMRKSVRLTVSVTNPRARDLYQRLGFRVVEEYPMDLIMLRSPGDRAQVIAAP